jgi:hypothetical protein
MSDVTIGKKLLPEARCERPGCKSLALFMAIWDDDDKRLVCLVHKSEAKARGAIACFPLTWLVKAGATEIDFGDAQYRIPQSVIDSVPEGERRK